MLSLSQIKFVLREYNIRPSKRLGQNFLIDNNIKDKIINSINLITEDVTLEIGPGLGALTGELSSRAKEVIAVEKDMRLYEFLSKNVTRGNLKLVRGDILKYDFSGHREVKVVGNLPYYISSPILIYLLKNRNAVSSIFVTVQKEFAERVVAVPDTREYGSISCFVNFYAEPKILFNIKKNSFYPVPKVDSCFLKIDIKKPGPTLTYEEKLFKIIRASFEKRRKTILNSLYSGKVLGSKKEVLAALEKACISPDRRPETVSLEEFIRLANVDRG